MYRHEVEKMTNKEIMDNMNEHMKTVTKAVNVISEDKDIDSELAYRILDNFDDIEKYLVMILGKQQLL